MKECASCHKQYETLRNTCPHCGGKDFIPIVASGDEAQTLLAEMGKKAEAKKHVDRGAQLTMQGRYAEAEAELKKAIEINPHNATAHGNMGGVFFHQKRYTEAIPWLEKALQLDPNLQGVPDALRQAKQQAGTGGKSNCFVATACYGSPEAPEVIVLRRFRDQVLAPSRFGRLTVAAYYRISPPIADWLRRNPRVRDVVRRCLLRPIVTRTSRR